MDAVLMAIDNALIVEKKESLVDGLEVTYALLKQNVL